MEPADIPKTAIITLFGLFEFLHMPLVFTMQHKLSSGSSTKSYVDCPSGMLIWMIYSLSVPHQKSTSPPSCHPRTTTGAWSHHKPIKSVLGKSTWSSLDTTWTQLGSVHLKASYKFSMTSPSPPHSASSVSSWDWLNTITDLFPVVLPSLRP